MSRSPNHERSEHRNSAFLHPPIDATECSGVATPYHSPLRARSVAFASVFGEIDHIGIAVEDIDGALALYRDKLGMREVHREMLEEQGVEAVLLEVGDAFVELIAPIDPDSGVARFVEKRGPGMHHVAYRTRDIEGDIQKLVAAGLRTIGDEPHPGIQDTLAIFVHPKSTGGVLTELVQPAEDH